MILPYNDGSPILITGGVGFIGERLANRLVKEGHHVIVLDHTDVPTILRRTFKFDFRQGSTHQIHELVPETPSLIYHLGEYARVESSFKDIEAVFRSNCGGTFAVLQYWRAKGCKLIYAGSSTKFSDLGMHGSPYAFTKGMNTELVMNFAKWFGLDYAITYFHNVYGPGERAGKNGTVIEIFRRLQRKGEPLPVVSPGTQKRHFTHIDDIVEGLVQAGEKGLGDGFELAAPEQYSILEVAEMFGGPIYMIGARPGNRMGGKPDTLRSEILGWKATRRLEDYIKECLK